RRSLARGDENAAKDVAKLNESRDNDGLVDSFVADARKLQQQPQQQPPGEPDFNSLGKNPLPKLREASSGVEDLSAAYKVQPSPIAPRSEAESKELAEKKAIRIWDKNTSGVQLKVESPPALAFVPPVEDKARNYSFGGGYGGFSNLKVDNIEGKEKLVGGGL